MAALNLVQHLDVESVETVALVAVLLLDQKHWAAIEKVPVVHST